MAGDVPRGTLGKLQQTLLEGADRLGAPLSEAQASTLIAYLEEMHRWNARMNLTAVRDLREMVFRHILDSLAALALLPFLKDASCPPFRCIDVGTGPGLPGLPLKVCRPQLQLALLESVSKKTVFLQAVVMRLKLKGVEILHRRLEGLAQDAEHGESYDILCSRAVRPELVLTHGFFLLRPGGRALIWASKPWEGAIPSVWASIQCFSYALPFAKRRGYLWLLTRS